MRSGLLGACILCFAWPLTTAQVQAQETPDKEASYTIIEALDPPRSETADTYRNLAARYSAKTDPAYVTVLDGNLVSGQENAPIPDNRNTRRETPKLDLGGAGVLMVVLVVIGGIFLWLKFGGAGTLLRREPFEIVPQQVPTGWNIPDANKDQDPRTLLDRIAAMADRSEAIVLLLRHCLLTGAQETKTRFARSDTERQAFRRLPRSWRFYVGLGELLRSAELAHYGGRPVSDEAFKASFVLGKSILGQSGKGDQGV